MVALDFLVNGRKSPRVAHFDHGTQFGDKAFKFVMEYCDKHDIPVTSGVISDQRHPGKSQEEHWRDERYRFFHSLDDIVITGQHLDDATEWWLFSSMHGEGKVMPLRNRNVTRPFLTTPRAELEAWATKRGVPWLDDPGNNDRKYMRSIIRHDIMPHALRVNPGLRTVVRKKLEAEHG